MADVKDMIMNGQTALGIEFGSTNIKAVLIDNEGTVLATGSHGWENSLIDGIWTYSQEEILAGLKSCYSAMRQDVEKKYGVTPATYGAMGISAMMHGYIALDKDGKLLSPFQTWRNSNTQQAADELTELFNFNIPLRWTIAHLYQCVLDQEEHLKDTVFVTTLDSYVHYLLTGEKNTGVGDASGMLDLSGWDTGNLKAVGEMFLKTKISKVDLSGWTFDAITNDRWEGAGKGIFYECGNHGDMTGFCQMFKDTPELTAVYVSGSGLKSFDAALEREVNIEDMWTNSSCAGFTAK